MHVLMYTGSYCPFCDRAKALLQAKGVVWEEISIDASPERRQEMIERCGQRTVPQIWIGDTHIGGSDDLAELERRGELDPLLERTP